jgi:transcriptional regulator with XRE-family HTH domain
MQPSGREMSPLERQRLIIGKTQGQVAADARCTKAAVSAYENRARRPHPKRIRDLAHALQLPIEQLVDLLAK